MAIGNTWGRSHMLRRCCSHVSLTFFMEGVSEHSLGWRLGVCWRVGMPSTADAATRGPDTDAKPWHESKLNKMAHSTAGTAVTSAHPANLAFIDAAAARHSTATERAMYPPADIDHASADNLFLSVGGTLFSELRDMLASDPGLVNFTPELCIFGSQNVGKSATLNHIIGYQVFPSDGAGLCTVCPIVVELIRVPGLAVPEGDVRVAGRSPQTGLKLEALVREIAKTMDQIAEEPGNGNASHAATRGYKRSHITDEPLHVTLRAHDVVDLIVTDLPGQIVNVVTDMNPSVPKQVRSLLLQKASNPK